MSNSPNPSTKTAAPREASTGTDNRKAASLFFIAALAVIFALQFGPGSNGCVTGKVVEETTVATVNGKKIPMNQFVQQYSAQMQQMRSQGITPEMVRQFGFHKQIVDQLVNTELLAQAAESRGILASDAELLETIKKAPDFQREGKFDKALYQQVLRDYARRTPQEYEADLRRRLSASKMLELVEAGAVVSDDEVKARFQKDGNKAKATFVKFQATQFAAKVPAPKPAELEAWAKAHEADIATYFAANKLSYFQPERVKVRQILIKALKDDGDAKRAEAKAKATEVRKQLETQDFATLAKQVSDDTETKDKGGDLGLVERFALPPALANAVFSANVGQLTDVVETPLGFFIAKVEEKKAPEEKKLENVRSEIAAQLYVRDAARVLAKAEAEKALKDAKAGKKLADLFPAAAESQPGQMRFDTQLKPEAVDTGEFNAGSLQIPQLGQAPDVFKAVFELSAPQLIDQAFLIGDSYVVINVEERQQATDANFETQKAQMKLEAIKGKQFELREAFLKGLKQNGKVVVNDRGVDDIVNRG